MANLFVNIWLQQESDKPGTACLFMFDRTGADFVCGKVSRRMRFLFQPGKWLIAALLVLSLAMAAGGCSLPKKVPTGPMVAGARVSNTALSTVGTRYVSGGTTPNKGFDCSGLVCWAYAQNGLNMPRTAREQSKVGSSVSKKSLREGDLVVFKIRGGMHTGIYTGKGKFVHSPSRGKTVREDKIDSIYWKDKFVAGRRHNRLQ